jgi:hypothetical protein
MLAAVVVAQRLVQAAAALAVAVLDHRREPDRQEQ